MIRLFDAGEADYGAIVALNEAALPHVSRMSRDALTHLHREAFCLRVARADDALAGFLLTLTEAAQYESRNFIWFRERYERFVYIDRIVVAEEWRGHGIGRALYTDLEVWAARHCGWLTCEVNLRPPNPGSMTFHHAFGFREIGQQDTEDGAKRVCMQVKPLESPP